MGIEFFLKGIIIGIFVSIPVGPISILGIRRTILKGPFYGIVSGAGAATADAIYCFIAAFGLTVISDFLLKQVFLFNVVGGTILLIFGIKVLMAKAPKSLEVDESANESKRGIARAFISTFIVAFTNPVTILSFIAIFAALGMRTLKMNMLEVSLIVSGVFAGAVGFWTLFSLVINHFREKFSITGLVRVNRISGIALLIFGLIVVFGLLVKPEESAYESSKIPTKNSTTWSSRPSCST